MAWVAEHSLASAVSEAGGLGLIGAGGAPASFVREEIRKAKERTGKHAIRIQLFLNYCLHLF